MFLKGNLALDQVRLIRLGQFDRDYSKLDLFLLFKIKTNYFVLQISYLHTFKESIAMKQKVPLKTAIETWLQNMQNAYS